MLKIEKQSHNLSIFALAALLLFSTLSFPGICIPASPQLTKIGKWPKHIGIQICIENNYFLEKS